MGALMSKILEELIACGVSSETIVAVAKLIADADQTQRRRERQAGYMRGYRKANVSLTKANVSTREITPHLPLKEIPQKAKKLSSGSQGATRLSPDWQLTPELRQFAIDHYQDPNQARDEFVDYWKSVPGVRGQKLDWEATFRNRVRDLERKAPRRNGNGGYRATYKDKRQEELEHVKQCLSDFARAGVEGKTGEPDHADDGQLPFAKRA